MAARGEQTRARAELRLFLRPAGGGIHTVSTGSAALAAFWRAYYGRATEAGARSAWLSDLGRLDSACVLMLGVPSDTGAGLVRGAAFGPLGLRTAWLGRQTGLRRYLRSRGVVDLGDVRSVPQLLDDEMLSHAQVRAARRALYGKDGRGLPVSPLSIARRVVRNLSVLAPQARLLVLGGDHSVAWPIVAALDPRGLGIVHIDAHTDLLPERQGIRYCFATWAFHALLCLERPARFVQLGIRASRHGREYWERLGLRQYRAGDLVGRAPERVAFEVAAELVKAGATRVYLSNDIDGTDGRLAPATGTPEPNGLRPAWVRRFITALGRQLPFVGADLVEVAPSVGAAAGVRRTLSIGTDYLEASLAAMLGPNERRTL